MHHAKDQNHFFRDLDLEVTSFHKNTEHVQLMLLHPPQLFQVDKYFHDDHVFEVLGKQVVVTGDLLAEAIAKLPDKKRDIILLSYFRGLSDREISEHLHVVRQAVSKHRAGILRELREILQKEGFEWL